MCGEGVMEKVHREGAHRKLSSFRFELLRWCGIERRMARKPRVDYAGAFYHVICRGNQRQVIFRSDADRKFYVERLEQYRRRHSFNLYAYVLMSNHVHLLLETC